MSEPTWELLGGGGVVGGPIDYVGAWAAGTTYQPGQVVRYGGIDYLAVNVSLGQVPPSAAPFGSGIGTSLPASPFDGMEYVLVDSLTAPTYAWRFRYTASITDAYKWVFVGGSDFVTRVDAEQTHTTAGYLPLSGGPSVSLARAGIYAIQLGATVKNPAAAATVVYMAITGNLLDGNVNTATPNGQQQMFHAGLVTIAAGGTVGMLAATSVGTVTFSDRFLFICPQRVA